MKVRCRFVVVDIALCGLVSFIYAWGFVVASKLEDFCLWSEPFDSGSLSAPPSWFSLDFLGEF